MFVPWTAKGKLVSRMKEEEDRLSELTNFRIKFQEEGGTPLWLMFPTSLVEGMDCGRDGCRTCKQNDEKKVDCFARSTVYQSSCELCHPPGSKKKDESAKRKDGGEGTYTGETSRSVFERVKEHYGDMESLRKDSHMVKHWFTSHPTLNEAPPFRFEIIGKYKDCLTRQLKEAVILGGKPNSLNSKGEFGGCSIPRLTIESDRYKLKLKELEERQKEEEEENKWKELVSRVRSSNTTMTGDTGGPPPPPPCKGRGGRTKTTPLWALPVESPLKRKRNHTSDPPPPHSPDLLAGPVPSTPGPEEIKTAKRHIPDANNGQTNRAARDTQEIQNLSRPDMEKVRNVRAQLTPDKNLMSDSNPDDRGKGGERRGPGGSRWKAVENLDIHALANSKGGSQEEKLERGGGTPKRRNENLLDRMEFESPAKKYRIRNMLDPCVT